ncbi:MAG TPA: SAM-dependent methyltransferase [Trebonia sp.]|nr:SAM-dependent methyltransferase [Trebonia sp.]
MEEDWGEDATRRAKAALISTLVPNAKRVADYMYGGQNNFEADRKAARSLAAAAPVVGRIAPAVRGFQQRALRFLVLEGGIRQFLDIGTDLPLVGSTHDVAQSLAPECRIVYVDNDPMVLSHARALMKSDPRGVVGYVDADVRDPGAIVAGAQGTLDFSQPIAVMLLFTLSYVQDAEEAAKVVSSLMAAVPSGSFLAIYHLASDLDDTMDEAARMWNKMMPTQSIVLRSAVEVGNLVPGLVPVPPGLVPVTDWRPVIDSRLDRADLVPASVPVYGIVARKP